MTAWIGVVGVLAGAFVALMGQFSLKRFDSRREGAVLVLDLCAQIVALEEDFRNRVWEERHLKKTGSVDEWNLIERRSAQARLKILAHDRPDVVDSVTRVNTAGKLLGKLWRMGESEPDKIEAAWQEHKVALKNFVETVGPIVRRRLAML